MGWIVKKMLAHVGRAWYLGNDKVTHMKGRWVFDPKDAVEYEDRHRADLACQMYKGHVVSKEEELAKIAEEQEKAG